MPVFDGPSFFRNTIAPVTGVNGAKRVPFTFTSTARLLRSGNVAATNLNSASANTTDSRRQQIASIESETRGIQAVQQLGFADIVDRSRNAKQATVGIGDMPIISMAVNPSSILWSQDKRISRTDTMEGSVFYHFTNSASQNNDILEMTFNGQTGNIQTNGDFRDIIATGANLKLRIWHELYNLTREKILITDPNNATDRLIKNEFFITYRTPLFPIQITLIGFFSSVLEFTENAQDPFNRNYSFKFTVTSTSPSLDQLPQLMNSGLSIAGQGDVNNIVQTNSSIG